MEEDCRCYFYDNYYYLYMWHEVKLPLDATSQKTTPPLYLKSRISETYLFLLLCYSQRLCRYKIHPISSYPWSRVVVCLGLTISSRHPPQQERCQDMKTRRSARPLYASEAKRRDVTSLHSLHASYRGHTYLLLETTFPASTTTTTTLSLLVIISLWVCAI